MNAILREIQRSPSLNTLPLRVEEGYLPALITQTTGAMRAVTAALLRKSCSRPVAVVCADDAAASTLAADLRAPTPSAAAELAVPELGKLKDGLAQSRDRLCSALRHGVERKRDRLELLIRRRGALLTEQRLMQEQQRLDNCRDALEEGIEGRLQRQRDALATVGARLKAADPLGALDRGFALVYDAKNDLVRRADDAAVGEGLTLRFRDGRVQAHVTGKDMT